MSIKTINKVNNRQNKLQKDRTGERKGDKQIRSRKIFYKHDY